MHTASQVHFDKLMQRYPALNTCAGSITQAFNLLARCFADKGKLLICGNGGSAADAEHIVGELMKGFLLRRPVPAEFRTRLHERWPEQGEALADHLQGALPAIALTGHLSLSTAFQNDVAADMVFAQQVYGYGHAGDVLLGISTSGNSKNVLNALRVAHSMRLRTIGLTGMSGGQMAALCDACICVPATQTLEVQELHLPVYHALCCMLEAAFFERG